MNEEIKMQALLWSKLRSHEYKILQARRRIEKWLSLVNNPYIAFSTGKDSTCLLHLVRAQKKEVPAIYFDAGCSFPESGELISQTKNLISFPTEEPLLATFHRFGGISGGRELERETMRTTVYEPIKRLILKYSFDGVAYGLRSEESRGRYMNAKMRGAIFQYKRDGLWACQPIHDWTYEDVWAYIISNDIPYCSVYDKMWDMPKEDQRLSYWAGETKRRWGRWAWLKRNYPELFNRFAAEFPEVRCYV